MVKNARIAALAIALLAAPSLGMAEATAVPAATPAVIPVPGDADYRIGPYDMLSIAVFEVNDLDRTVQVDATGNVKLPLIGVVPAAGRTTTQLSGDIRAALESKYLKHANVTVQVKTSESLKVTVDGAVQSPGIYPIGSHVTLMQAVAMAKGLDEPNANAHKVTIFRNVGSQWTSTHYDLLRIRHGQDEDPVVEGKDVIVVANSHKPAVLTALGNVLPYVLLLGAL
jgi:polysaccharide export outer membrane protein